MHIFFEDCWSSWYTLRKYYAQINMNTCIAVSKKLTLTSAGSLKICPVFVATLGLAW